MVATIKKKSSLKLLSQSQPNFAEMILRWSPFKIVSVSAVLYPNGEKNNMSMHMSLSINRRGKWEMGLSLSANTRKKIGKWVIYLIN
jgi:hypothetical protein